jgi:hypothetical protein
MRIKNILLLLIVFCFSQIAFAFSVPPKNSVIIVDKKADGVIQFAAKELQKYLKLITGVNIPIVNKKIANKYSFIFDKPKNVILKDEEACWEVNKSFTLLYGDSTYIGTPKIQLWKILTTKSKSGDLTAVYDFLEKQLGVLFLAPGKDGVYYKTSKTLNLQEGKNSWVPPFRYRFMWPDRAFWQISKLYHKNGKLKSKRNIFAPDEFMPQSASLFSKKEQETRLWLKQQRMGESGEKLYYGHAFTKWWKRFHKTHPEYFALTKGKRQPLEMARTDWNKLCVSNPAVWKQIVSDWAALKNRPQFINACENDGYGFCECSNCRKLDMPTRKGDKWYSDLSDRYVYFANQVLKEAKKIDPNVKVCQYAYSFYRYPPRREKVTSDNYLIFVPSMMDLDRLNEDYQNWYNVGARNFFLRPNDLHLNTNLPMGFDKQIFDAFKIGYKYGIFGTSYDTLHGFWDISGLADYVIARAHIDPTKDYDYYVNEYCSSYGLAAKEAKEYFDYIRKNIWDKQLWPKRKEISNAGRYGNFRQGLMWNIHTYYSEKDFDNLDKIIHKGLAKKLSKISKYRMETLLLVNQHSRLTFRALAAKGKEKIPHAVKLIQFRRTYKDRLNINWGRLFHIEISNDDCTGIKAAELLSQYNDFCSTPQWWVFCTDPDNVGEKEEWHKLSFREFQKKAKKMIRTDANWEKQRYLKDEAYKNMLKTYDGIAFYGQNLKIPKEWKNKEIYLIFGAVDESAWVYINGKFAGKHLYVMEDDWKTPFAIPITDKINWSQEKQKVIVRVEDKSGLGGIWKPVLLGAIDKKK